MFYLILAILLVLFYIFAAPKAIKGTLNLMLLVFAVVLVVTSIILAIISLTRSTLEVWVGGIVVFLGFWAIWDMEKMTPKLKTKSKNKIVSKP
ncbi:DUF3165 family protein [Streptococcus rifensis]